MKRNQSSNHGSVKHSFLNLKSKQEASSSASTRTNVEQLDHFESPYRGSLSEIKQITQINLDNDDDFRISKPLKKESKSSSKKPIIKKTTIRKRTRKPGSIQKCTKDNFKNIDVNPEHLQMAIALSNSTLALENPERFKKNQEPDLPTFLSPDRIPKKGTILERYGFKSSKTKKDSESHMVHEEPKKRKNYSKFRFITPILQTRSDEDRQSLIISKISMIISQQRHDTFKCANILQETLYSDSLQPYNCLKKHILNVDPGNYYCTSLGLPFSKSVYGCLLKDWNQIPGRDRSPEKCTKNVDTSFCNTEGGSNESIVANGTILTVSEKNSISLPRLRVAEVKNDEIFISDHEPSVVQTESVTIRNCASPDLFESDIESPFLKSPSISGKSISFSMNQTLTSPVNIKIAKVPKQLSTIFGKYNDPINKTLNNIDECSSPKHSLSKSSSSKTDDKNNLYTFGSTDSGIEYFESFCKNSEDLSKSVYNLVSSQKECDVPKKDDFSRSHFSNIDKFISSSSSIALSTDSGIENAESVCKNSVVAHDFEINKEICQEICEELIDLTQSSNSNEAGHFTIINDKKLDPDDCDISDFSEESEDPSKKSMHHQDEVGIRLDNEFYDSLHKTMESSMHPHIQETNNLPNSPTNGSENVDFDKISIPQFASPKGIPEKNIDITENEIETENVYTEDNSEKSSKRASSNSRISTPRTSDEMYDYNCTNSLNVTDYVTQMLNSQAGNSETQEINGNEFESFSQTSSQTSIVISDEELNYSSLHSADQKNEDFYNLSKYENFMDTGALNCEDIKDVHKDLRNKYSTQSFDKIVEEETITTEPTKKSADISTNNTGKKLIGSKKDKGKSSTDSSPVKVSQLSNISTPENNMIIKTQDVTPMANYEEMDTPKIRKELDKFGFKPLKRQKGIKLLKYIYESTHPVVRSEKCNLMATGDEEQAYKKRRTLSPSRIVNEPAELTLIKKELVIKENPEDLIFERKPSKISSCRMPLQVAWYNFLSSNPQLHNNILLYEPLHLEVIYSMLKDQSGCAFHLEDFITFLDKKCITFRTAQNKNRIKKVKQ